MVFAKKIRDVFISVLPIVAIVFLVHFFISPIETSLLIKFLISSILLIVGETFFLTGVDSTIMPMGEMVGNNVKKVSSIFLFIFFAFLFGMFATIAEPDVQTLVGEIVDNTGLQISSFALLFILGAGVGLFMAFALLRIVKKIPIKILYLVFLAIAFVLATFLPESFIAVAFDAGGTTVGIVTTPFVLALTAGVVEKCSQNTSDNFGVIGLAGLGPIIAVLILSLFITHGTAASVVESASFGIFVDVLINSIMAIVPLVFLFYIFEVIYIKLPKNKKRGLIIGVIVTFVGLYSFLFSINYGLIGMGQKLGSILHEQNLFIVILIYALFAFSIVFTEPAIRVLGSQIEAETQGNVNRRIIVISLAISMVLAVVIAALRIYFDVNIWYFLGVGYALILAIMPFSDDMFVSIAFDSGGVAGGPVTTALVLTAMITMSSGSEGFGLVSIMNILPILVLEIAGVVYNVKTKGFKLAKRIIAARVSYGAEKYSNMEKLEKRYNELKEQRADAKKQD